MNATKLLTALMAMLVVSAGAGAVSAASIDAETTTVDATYADGTVTLTVLDNGTGVENVSVETENFSGTTDANGTVAFDTNATEVDVEFTKDNTTFERSYVIDGDSITEAADEEAEEDEEDESMLAASVSYDNGTVDVEVTKNGSAVENVSVTANGEEQGMTDANGTLTFETNATEELELEFEKGEMELEQKYTIEDGSLVMVEDDEEDDKELSANENASERAHNVLAVIQGFLTDGGEGNLGQMIQDALGDDRGNSENAKENGNGNAANANANANNDNKGNGNADKADKKNDKADEKGNNGNGHGHADDDDDDDDDEEEEDDEEEGDEETETDA